MDEKYYADEEDAYNMRHYFHEEDRLTDKTKKQGEKQNELEKLKEEEKFEEKKSEQAITNNEKAEKEAGGEDKKT